MWPQDDVSWYLVVFVPMQVVMWGQSIVAGVAIVTFLYQAYFFVLGVREWMAFFLKGLYTDYSQTLAEFDHGFIRPYGALTNQHAVDPPGFLDFVELLIAHVLPFDTIYVGGSDAGSRSDLNGLELNWVCHGYER